jgi:hypothetical protein
MPQIDPLRAYLHTPTNWQWSVYDRRDDLNFPIAKIPFLFNNNNIPQQQHMHTRSE